MSLGKNFKHFSFNVYRIALYHFEISLFSLNHFYIMTFFYLFLKTFVFCNFFFLYQQILNFNPQIFSIMSGIGQKRKQGANGEDEIVDKTDQ